MAAKIIHNPQIDAEVWRGWMQVAKGEAFAAVFELHEADNTLRSKYVLPNGSAWNQIVCDDNAVQFIGVNVRYRTNSGGKRCKLTFISYVPDSLERPSWKETIRIKTVAIGLAGQLKSGIVEHLGMQAEPVCRVEANVPEEFSRAEILAKASKFERDTIDQESVDELMPLG